MDFAETLTEVGRFLDERGMRYGLAGALALHALGLTRATSDLHFVVEARAADELMRFLDSLGYERLHVSSGYSNHVHADAARGRLDFIYLDSRTSQLLFDGARRLTLFPDVEVLVPRPEHLAAMKVLAMKNDPSRTFAELADLQFLLGLPGVDREEIRGYFEKHGLLERFHDIERISHRP